MTPVLLSIEQVEYDSAYFPRESIDLDVTVAKYTEALVHNPDFHLPPIVVVKRTGRTPPYIVLDGVHRLLSYGRAERSAIPALVERLPESQWFARSVELNAAHGRPLTQTDQRIIVRRLESDGWAIDKIAGLLKVRADTILLLRGSSESGKITTHPKPVRPKSAQYERGAFERLARIVGKPLPKSRSGTRPTNRREIDRQENLSRLADAKSLTKLVVESGAAEKDDKVKEALLDLAEVVNAAVAKLQKSKK